MYQATRTVDGENLSEIAIHNFEKNRKIENAVGPSVNRYVPTFTMTESVIETPLHRIKLWQMGNSCNSKKLGRKYFRFIRFFRKWCDFFNFFFCAILRTSGISMEWPKEIPEFP